MKVTQLSVDLIGARAVVHVMDNSVSPPGKVIINVPVEAPGDKSEASLQQSAKDAARKALQDALSAI